MVLMTSASPCATPTRSRRSKPSAWRKSPGSTTASFKNSTRTMVMKIAVLPGDGIGPEIVTEDVKVLKALDLPFEMEEAKVGGAAYDAHGHPLPPATLKLAMDSDAVLFGAVGDWKYDKLDRPLRP